MGNRADASVVLAVCNHPGGVNAILPVVTALQRQGVSCSGVVTRWGADRFRDAGIVVEVVRSPMRVAAAAQVLRERHPDIVLLGTSEPEDPVIGRLEAMFTVAARDAGIPTVAVLDFWSAYGTRFSLRDDRSLDALADVVCVMDERARSAMVGAGVPDARIVITGNPHWDALAGVSERLRTMDRRELRARAGYSDADRVILFVSQPLTDGGGPPLGYTQDDVRDTLVQMRSMHPDWRIVVRPHPREDRAALATTIASYASTSLALADAAADAYTTGWIADAIVGMFSMLLVEYALLGFPVVSYQPTTAAARVDLADGITVVDRVIDLEQFLVHPIAPRGDVSQRRAETARVVAEVHRVLAQRYRGVFPNP